ncbi:hypothetical protein FSP39_024211 [Pinctada imbricata]|uniref:Malate dehydrogenase n=1 Tax=Pinctada imbricata TaxID=66713 RepID=A0AA88XR22_PINIB|nr:hypothetical protein FSP39_024211 [Pinctada imbricata]
MADDRVVIPLDDVHHFIVKVMRTLGATEDHSALLAEVLTTADLRGHYSHGLNRLDMYVGELRTGVTIKTDEKPVILKETCATALVDGKSLLGWNKL